jgi:hypothetical protein
MIQGIRAGLGMARLPWLSDVTPIAVNLQDAPLDFRDFRRAR